MREKEKETQSDNANKFPTAARGWTYTGRNKFVNFKIVRQRRKFKNKQTYETEIRKYIEERDTPTQLMLVHRHSTQVGRHWHKE